MAKLSKNSPIVEVFSTAILKNGQLTEVQKADYNDALELIKELAKDPRPDNLYELQQIVAYVIDTIIDTRVDYIDTIADVKRTNFQERPKWKTKTEGIVAYWQAMAGTADRSRVGHKYSGIEVEELSAMPYAEWAEIASGRYDFAELIRDVSNEFEAKIAQKVQDTLYAAFSQMSAPNYGAGSGVVSNTFDPLLTSMQRFGRAAIIGDIEALQQLPALTTIQSRTSDNIIDEFNRNGVIGYYKGSPVVQLNNQYAGWEGYETVLNKGFIYIVPVADAASKTLKVQFAGEVQPMSVNDINNRSYQMRYDLHMGAGVVDAGRHPLAVYEDTALSGM